MKKLSILAALLVLGTAFVLILKGPSKSLGIFAKPSNIYYEVNNFYDGDTVGVLMNGKEQRIRFIGVDTPETHHPDKPAQCFGPNASEFTKNIIGSGRVRLESDSESTNYDRYDRLLRYVYLEDGTLLNQKLIEEGYGFSYSSFPFSRLSTFQHKEEEARSAKKGLWGSCQATLDNGFYQTNALN